MPNIKLNKLEKTTIEKAVTHFEKNKRFFENLSKSLVDQLCYDPVLKPLIHSIKYRVKDPDHLKGKLVRKAIEYKGAKKNNDPNIPEAITNENLFRSIHDLAGVRLIHLHTNELQTIHSQILTIFEEQNYELIEDPIAKCWDTEYEAIYKKLGLKTEITIGYSSVHYVVKPNQKTEITCELQVRTLADEIWGEVSHSVNYPDQSPCPICRDQLNTLARFTTGCTRLIDSIFKLDDKARKRNTD